MRLTALIATLLTLTACSTVEPEHPYAEPNALMRREIQSRIANIPFQHRQELLNNLLWLSAQGGESAIPDLLKVLCHEDPKVRSSACWVLGRIRDRRTIPQLRPLAEDKNDSVRFEAARSLTLMGDMKFATLLIEGLDSDRIPVRYNCHMALRDATNRDFQYDHLEDDPAERNVAVLRWREWWSEISEDPFFAQSYAQKHGLESKFGAMEKQPGTQPAAPIIEMKPVPAKDDQPQPGKGAMPQPEGKQPAGKPQMDGKTPKMTGTDAPKQDGAKVPDLNAVAVPPATVDENAKKSATKGSSSVEPWIDRILEKTDGSDSKGTTNTTGTKTPPTTPPAGANGTTPPKAGTAGNTGKTQR